MKLIYPTSLAATLDSVNEAFFYGKGLAKGEKKEVARWIAGRQGLPRSYWEMFAPTEKDFKDGIKVFTGESVVSAVATSHILGEEACRSLILLDVPDENVQSALDRATKGMMSALERYEEKGYDAGFYCCGKCSASLWRNLAVGGLDKQGKRLASGLKALRSYRDGKGEWRRFPFFYTLLALSEIDAPAAIDEIRYTAKVCERYLARAPGDGKYDKRRRAVVGRALKMC